MSVKDAIDQAGGAPTVAKRFNISSVSVYEWITKARLPADRVIPLAELTGWKYTPHKLDPNLYPNPTDGLPPAVAAQQPPPST